MRRELIEGLFAHAEKIRSEWDAKRHDSDPWEEVETVTPCSETTAVIVIRKASGMRVVILAFWIKAQGGRWSHFFPTYEHLYGLKNNKIYETMNEVEEKNAEIRRRDWQDRPNLTVIQ